MNWQLGPVGHFGLAVRRPSESARWWTGKLHLTEQFRFDDGIAVGNDAITIALHEGTPHPETLNHLSFHLRSMAELEEAVEDLRTANVMLEDPGDEIGPEAPGSPHYGAWFHDPDGYRWELSVQNAAQTEQPRKRKR